MSPEEAEKICNDAAERTNEHFDSVLVIASWSPGDKETHRIVGFSGNYFTCIGMAHDFLESSSHDELATRLAEAISEREGWGGDDDDDKVS